MSARIYIVNFLVNSANLFDFEHFLRTSSMINGYWNYIPLSYCIKSYYDATGLSQQMGRFFPGGNFLVAEVNPVNMNGILPSTAWDWFLAPPEQRGALSALPQFNLLDNS